MKRVAVLLLLAMTAPCAAQAPDAPASGDPAAANAFYAIYGPLVGKGGGVPDTAARLRYAPVLSPRLNKQFHHLQGPTPQAAPRLIRQDGSDIIYGFAFLG